MAQRWVELTVTVFLYDADRRTPDQVAFDVQTVMDKSNENAEVQVNYTGALDSVDEGR